VPDVLSASAYLLFWTIEMKLIPNAKAVLRKAWSVRLGILAGLFSGAEVVVPFFADSMPRNVFALLVIRCCDGCGDCAVRCAAEDQ
jgi:hypothetical protein